MPKYNRSMRTVKYTDEFKATAVLLSHLDDCSVKSVAESLDIHPVMLSNWRRMYHQGKIVTDKRKKIVKKPNPKKVATISRGTKAEKFQYINRYKDQFGVKRLCQHLKVSRSGYYDWMARGESTRSKTDHRLLIHIQRIFDKSMGVYGSPRIHQALRKIGICVGRKRVARLMKQAGLKARFATIYRYRSKSFENTYIADNLRLNGLKPASVNQHWTTDLTYLRLEKNWIYLVVILDLYSRRVVGWSIGNEKNSALVIRALECAIRKRQPAKGLLLHSDRGTEYVSSALKAKTEHYGMIRSMSRAYRSIDNAEMESFFQKLKGEYLKGKTYRSLKQVRKDVASYINHFYNPTRLHSSLDYLSPMEFEARAA